MRNIAYSIIIPYHKVNDDLKSLIDSIYKSHQSNFEVILVSDGAADISKNFQLYDNLIVLHLDENSRWAGAARNLGVLNCKGDYIIFADSDDYFLEGWNETISINIDNNIKSDILFFLPIAKFKSGLSSPRANAYKKLVLDSKYNSKKDILFKFHVPWSKVYRTDFIKSNNIKFEEIIASNDVNFSLNCALLQKNYYVSTDSYYCVVEHQHSLTKNISKTTLESRFFAIVNYNETLDSFGYSQKKIPTLNLLIKSLKIDFSTFIYFLSLSFKYKQPLMYKFSEVFSRIMYFSKNRENNK